MGVNVCERTVSVLMTQAGLYGLPGPTRVKRLCGVVTADVWGSKPRPAGVCWARA